MSPERRRLALAASLGLALALAAPSPAAAHAIGGSFQLPVPLWLYLLGAAAAVAASFVATARTTRGPAEPGYATFAVPSTLAAVLRTLLRLIGLAWWYGAIVVGIVV